MWFHFHSVLRCSRTNHFTWFQNHVFSRSKLQALPHRKIGGTLRGKMKFHIEWLTTSSSGQDVALWPRQPRFDSWCGQVSCATLRSGAILLVVVAGLWRMARALRGGVVRWSCFLAMQCRRHGGCQVGQQARHAGGWCIYVEFMLAHVRGDSTVAARWCRWCTHVCTWDSCWGAPPRQ